jgi:hypothetical protein
MFSLSLAGGLLLWGRGVLQLSQFLCGLSPLRCGLEEHRTVAGIVDLLGCANTVLCMELVQAS